TSYRVVCTGSRTLLHHSRATGARRTCSRGTESEILPAYVDSRASHRFSSKNGDSVQNTKMAARPNPLVYSGNSCRLITLCETAMAEAPLKATSAMTPRHASPTAPALYRAARVKSELR